MSFQIIYINNQPFYRAVSFNKRRKYFIEDTQSAPANKTII